MKILAVLFIVAFLCISEAWNQPDDYDQNLSDLLFNRIYRTNVLKTKRSPSFGLSLAEYIAGPQANNRRLHFLNGPQPAAQKK